MSPSKRPKITAPSIRARKGGRPIVALTAYDKPTGDALDEAGVDILLVGDSVGMVVHGYETTLPVTMDLMVRHTQAVARAKPSALLVADMPFLSYHVSTEEAIRNAGRLVQEGGAEAVKVEGGRCRTSAIAGITSAGIPVMGHLGLTPQSYHSLGGFRVQGRTPEAVETLLEDLRALERAGVFSVVLEGLPAEVAGLLTGKAAVPTIGIGAGPRCDGQILVVNDLLGWNGGYAPKFVRRYADFRAAAVEAVRAFAEDVAAGRFPSAAESYSPATERAPSGCAEPGEDR